MSDAPAARRIYVLDASVLLNDPGALFRFGRHDICLPLVVLEALDRSKTGLSEAARNARQVSRHLDALAAGRPAALDAGLPLPAAAGDGGRLFFHLGAGTAALPPGLSPDTPGNLLLGAVQELRDRHAPRPVILVSRDIHLRIKAHVLGLEAEDYTSEYTAGDSALLYTGTRRLPAAFWARWPEAAVAEETDGRPRYRLRDPQAAAWQPNEFLLAPEGLPFPALRVQRVAGGEAVLAPVVDHRREDRAVWGVRARNLEQSLALELLLDPEVDLVTLLGQAGTGKTLLALAAGLQQTLEGHRYREILVTRATVPVGSDIGFLPGTEEEKMEPWMGALEDNLDVLAPAAGDRPTGWGRAATADLLRARIRVKSLNFMRGRTFLDKFIVIDEAQNLTPHEIKTLVTRAGAGSKVVCLGNIAQIDTPYLTEATSGLAFVVDRFKAWAHSGHVTLQRVERSRLADYAGEML